MLKTDGVTPARFDIAADARHNFPMRSSVAFLILLALLPLRNDAAQLRTNFVTNAVLSVDDLDAVVKLAKQCRMNNIGEVRTFYYRPGRAFCGIEVKSPEVLNGRVITFQTLRIDRDGWSYRTNLGGAQQIPRVRSFWVYPPVRLEDHKEFTFKVGNDILRVEISDKIPLETADKIVTAFDAGRIHFKDDSVKRRVEPENLTPPDTCRKPTYSHPTWMGTSMAQNFNLGTPETQNHFWISFSGSLDRYEFDLEGDGVKILAVVSVNV